MSTSHHAPIHTRVDITFDWRDRLRILRGYPGRVQTDTEVQVDCFTDKVDVHQSFSLFHVVMPELPQRWWAPWRKPKLFTATGIDSRDNPYPEALRKLRLRMVWGVPAIITLVTVAGIIDPRLHLGMVLPLAYGLWGMRRMKLLAQRAETVQALTGRRQPMPEAPPPDPMQVGP